MDLPTLISRIEPISNFGSVGWYNHSLISKSVLNILLANSEDPDQKPYFAVSDLDLHCLPMSHKRTLGLWVNTLNFMLWLSILFYHGILQRNYRKMRILWSFSYNSYVKLSL